MPPSDLTVYTELGKTAHLEPGDSSSLVRGLIISSQGAHHLEPGDSLSQARGLIISSQGTHHLKPGAQLVVFVPHTHRTGEWPTGLDSPWWQVPSHLRFWRVTQPHASHTRHKTIC